MDERMYQTKYDTLKVASQRQLESLVFENEMLLDINARLEEENQTLRAQVDALQQHGTTTRSPDVEKVFPQELLCPGEPASLPTCVSTWTSCPCHASGKNPLCVSIHPRDPLLILTGGVDHHVCLTHWSEPEPGSLLSTLVFRAPVIAVEWNPSRETPTTDLILVACLDTTVHLAWMNPDTQELELRQTFDGPTSCPGNISGTWHVSGQSFVVSGATVSDPSIRVYEQERESTRFHLTQSFYVQGPVEAVTAASGSSGAYVVAVRNDCYLHYIDDNNKHETTKNEWMKTRVNMNVDGIEHVSYTILHLASSPCGNYLVAATDQKRLLLFRMFTNVVLRTFVGHEGSRWSQPRVTFDPTGKYILSNAESTQVVVYCIASGKIIRRLDEHQALVRDLSCRALSSSPGELPPKRMILATVSYDKSLRVWTTR